MNREQEDYQSNTIALIVQLEIEIDSVIERVRSQPRSFRSFATSARVFVHLERVKSELATAGAQTYSDLRE